MRNLKTRADLDAPILQLGNGQREVGDPVDEHRLVALEMTRQQQRWRVGAKSNHRHPRPERLDRKHKLRAHLIGEVLKIGCHVPAGEVDELEPVEHEREPTLRETFGRSALRDERASGLASASGRRVA
jgi:hypothetical protein